MRTRFGVMRCGRTAGTLVPMRMISTCGISRRRDRSQLRRSSFKVSGSPPEISTSRTDGVERMYSIARSKRERLG